MVIEAQDTSSLETKFKQLKDEVKKECNKALSSSKQPSNLQETIKELQSQNGLYKSRIDG